MIEMPLSLTEAATALRDGMMTSVELTTAALGRADAVDERLGVYRSRLDARAMDAAGRADADFATGRDRGLLQGIPIGLMDIPAIGDGAADGAAIGPSPVLDPAWLTEREAPVVARIRRAGAVITGRLSSSGTGMGVAAGLFLAGVGPDTDASIRIPAACCGISGLVPTSGRVPVGGGRDHVAPLARSARDCAAVLGVIADHHHQLAGGGDGAAGEYLGALCGSLAGVRLGVHRATAYRHDADRNDTDPDDTDPDDTGLDDAGLDDAGLDDTDPEVAGLVDDAVAVLGNLGADLVEVTLPSCPGGGPRARRARRGAVLEEMATLFAGVDAVVGATTAMAPGFEEPLDGPVLVLPMGFGSRGQPLSLQVVGRPFEETAVLRVGDAYQQITDWHRQIPDLAGAPAGEA